MSRMIFVARIALAVAVVFLVAVRRADVAWAQSLALPEFDVPVPAQSDAATCRASGGAVRAVPADSHCGRRPGCSYRQTMQMPPHYPYFPPMHGYYYFRPYHQSHFAQQPMIVTGWGGDPQHPYANAIFQKVYAAIAAEAQEPGEEKGGRQP